MANHEVRARRSMGEWKIRSVPVRLSSVLLTTALMLLAGCGPPYLADTYTTSTQKPASLDANSLARVPVVVLGFMASGTLQGLAPTMSHALSGALAEVNPPIREISTQETMNRLTDKGLAAEYADMRTGFRAKWDARPAAIATDWFGAWLAICSATRTRTARRRDTR